jgi:hypothetical protein
LKIKKLEFMNKEQNNSNYLKKKLSLASSVKAETYTAPDIEIIDIQLEQNILQSGSGDIPGMPGEPW